jgi:hypothetical protein
MGIKVQFSQMNGVLEMGYKTTGMYLTLLNHMLNVYDKIFICILPQFLKKGF